MGWVHWMLNIFIFDTIFHPSLLFSIFAMDQISCELKFPLIALCKLYYQFFIYFCYAQLTDRFNRVSLFEGKELSRFQFCKIFNNFFPLWKWQKNLSSIRIGIQHQFWKYLQKNENECQHFEKNIKNNKWIGS